VTSRPAAFGLSSGPRPGSTWPWRLPWPAFATGDSAAACPDRAHRCPGRPTARPGHSSVSIHGLAEQQHDVAARGMLRADGNEIADAARRIVVTSRARATLPGAAARLPAWC